MSDLIYNQYDKNFEFWGGANIHILETYHLVGGLLKHNFVLYFGVLYLEGIQHTNTFLLRIRYERITSIHPKYFAEAVSQVSEIFIIGKGLKVDTIINHFPIYQAILK